MRTITLSWQQVQDLGEKVVHDIKESGFKPDYLVGIASGGLIPLALLAEGLGIRNILTVSASSYAGTVQGKLEVGYLPTIDLEGKKVLLIDEIAETGETLRRISGILKYGYRVGELKAAVLAMHNTKCTYPPDFFAMQAAAWIEFPWEKPLPAA